MRKLIFAACALAYSMGVFAQGTVVFNNRVVGSVVTHIYGPNPANPYKYQWGDGDPIDNPQDWSGFPLLSGSGYTAQLWAAPGFNQPENSLQPAVPTTTFRTGAAAGFVVGTTATLPNVPPDDTQSGGGSTMVVRVWDNQGGTISSWAMATAPGHIGIWGESPLFNIPYIGGALLTPPNLVGLQSFNLTLHPIPEPSVFALASLGTAGLLIFRRRFREKRRRGTPRWRRILRKQLQGTLR